MLKKKSTKSSLKRVLIEIFSKWSLVALIKAFYDQAGGPEMGSILLIGEFAVKFNCRPIVYHSSRNGLLDTPFFTINLNSFLYKVPKIGSKKHQKIWKIKWWKTKTRTNISSNKVGWIELELKLKTWGCFSNLQVYGHFDNFAYLMAFS